MSLFRENGKTQIKILPADQVRTVHLFSKTIIVVMLSAQLLILCQIFHKPFQQNVQFSIKVKKPIVFSKVDELIKKYEKAEAEAEAAKKEKEKEKQQKS